MKVGSHKALRSPQTTRAKAPGIQSTPRLQEHASGKKAQKNYYE